MTMSSLGALQVKADVAEADISEVRVGQPATVTLSADDRRLTGTVTSVDTVQTVTNNVVEYGVTVTLARPTGVKLGQTSQVVITTGSKQNVLRVSSSALTTIGNQTTATVQAQGRLDPLGGRDDRPRRVTARPRSSADCPPATSWSCLSRPAGAGSFTFPGAGVGSGLGGTP